MNDVISLKNFLNIGHYPKFYLKDRNGNFEFFAIGENGGISNFKIHLQGFNSNTDATWIKNIKTTIIPESVIIKNRDGTTFLGYPLPRTEGNNQQSVNTMIEEIGIAAADLASSARHFRQMKIGESFLDLQCIERILIIAPVDTGEITIHSQIAASAACGAILEKYSREF